jgi:hypothetical protein
MVCPTTTWGLKIRTVLKGSKAGSVVVVYLD